jgi:hypothetical protein
MKQNRRSFLRNTALFSGAITLGGFTSKAEVPAEVGYLSVNAESESTGSAAIRRQFQSPGKKYRTLVRWWWPGNDVTEPELRREIEVLVLAAPKSRAL